MLLHMYVLKMCDSYMYDHRTSLIWFQFVCMYLKYKIIKERNTAGVLYIYACDLIKLICMYVNHYLYNLLESKS